MIGLLASAGCGPSTPTAAEATAAAGARFVLLPGCGPYQDMILHMQGAAGLLVWEVDEPTPPRDVVQQAAHPPPRPLVPVRLRHRARMLERWAAEARKSAAVETPWGTSSADVGNRLAGIASATSRLADAAEKSNAAGVEAARAQIFDRLDELRPLAAWASQMCFSLKGTPHTGRRPTVDEIHAVVRNNVSAYQRCYEDGLKRNRFLIGKVEVRFHIDRFGLVSTAVIDDATLPDPEVIDCIEREFTRLEFPPPTHGLVSMAYPIWFKPGEPPESAPVQ